MRILLKRWRILWEAFWLFPARLSIELNQLMFGISSYTDPFISTYSALVVFNWSGLSSNFSNSNHRRPALVFYPCFIFLHSSHHSLMLFACDLSSPIGTKQRWCMSHLFITTSTNLEIDLLVYSRCSLVKWKNFYIVVLPSLRNLTLRGETIH